MMQFKVLGALVVIGDNGALIPLPSAAQRRLASLLAMRAGSIVSADFLADHLELSSGALRTSVTRLRRLVGHDVLVTAAPGYELRTDHVDAKRFESLLAEARTAEGSGARIALESANALWFGGAYLEFAHEPWAMGEVARLEELRAGGVEDLAELLLASQEWSLSIAHLESLIETQPFRDRPRRLLMEALARSGRRTDALRAYQIYRRFLADEVGIEPSATVVALDRAIAQEEFDAPPLAAGIESRIGKQTVQISQAGTFPLPGRLSRLARGAFAGRVVERMLLRRQFHEVAGGERRVALVGGEPGIGKTTLACAVAVAAHDEGAIVLLGRCDEDISVPYQAWIEALEHLVTHMNESALNAVGLRHLVELGGLVPTVRERCPGVEHRSPTETDADRYRLFASVVALLETASAASPIVLVFDDAQWADTPTLLLLRHVLQCSAQLRLQMIMTFRDGRVEPTSALGDLFGALSREEFVQRISLAGLLDAEIVELIENTAERSLNLAGVALARELRRETDGNPFFVGELLRHLAESGAFTVGDSTQSLTAAALTAMRLPETVRDVIRQRVGRLGLSAQHVLRLAAVVGREFDVDVVSAVSETPPIEVIGVLERAEFASLVHQLSDGSGRYTFTHALIDQTLYGDLGTARSRIAHREIGEALERLRSEGADVRISELAHHWMSGGRPADSAKMVAYAREVGDAAVAALAPDEAARWYRDALGVVDRQSVPDQRLRAELLILLGTTQLKDGEQSLLEAARIAHDQADGVMLVRSVLADRRGWQSHWGSVDLDRLEIVEAALEVVGTADSPERARLLKGYASDLAYGGDPARCLQLDQEAVQIARRLSDPDTLLRALIRRPVGFWAPDSLKYRLTGSREAVVLADRGGDPSSIFWANHDLAFVAAEVGSRAEFDQAAERIDSVVGVLGQQPGFDWLIAAFDCVRAILTGNLDEAERFANLTALQALEAGNRNVDSLVSMFLANVWFQQGDERSAIPLLTSVVNLSSRHHSNRALLARAHFTSGDSILASHMVEEEFQQGFPAPWDKYWKLATCYWSEVAVLVGHRPAAQLLYDRLLPWSDQISVVSQAVENAVDFYLGLLATVLDAPDLANGHFARALVLNESFGARFQIAQTQLEWGRMLLLTRHPDRQRAYELCSSANEQATACGFTRVQKDARLLLDSLRKQDSAL